MKYVETLDGSDGIIQNSTKSARNCILHLSWKMFSQSIIYFFYVIKSSQTSGACNNSGMLAFRVQSNIINKSSSINRN